MILVDTSVIVAWLDARHPNHIACAEALVQCSALQELAVSAVTFAELAAGGRTREALDEDLAGFTKIDLSFEAAFRAGQAFRTTAPGKNETRPVLPDFFIRSQAAVLGIPHLTNDHRRTRAFPEVDFLFPAP